MTWTVLLELVMESDANGDGTIDLGMDFLIDEQISSFLPRPAGGVGF